eukprot:jgi/Botrbrau1/18453/Bobra.0072s0036.1
MAPEGDDDGGPSDPCSREIGNLAVWTVMSAKPGNGVDMLRDSRQDTYWQSDGMQPHVVNIQFQRKVRLREVAVYLDFKLDESYTPKRISVRVGTSFYDLREITVLELNEPQGWIRTFITPPGSPEEHVKAYFVQLAVLANHQQGRDTHIRQIKIYGPRQASLYPLGGGFASLEMTKYATLR